MVGVVLGVLFSAGHAKAADTLMTKELQVLSVLDTLLLDWWRLFSFDLLFGLLFYLFLLFLLSRLWITMLVLGVSFLCCHHLEGRLE